MDEQSLHPWRVWLSASLAASLLLFLVPLLFPATHPWPFVLLNWLIFAPGALIVARQTSSWPAKNFRLALLAFAAAGLATLWVSSNWP